MDVMVRRSERVRFLHLVALTALLAAGCASVQPHLVPMPAVLKDPRMDAAAQIPQALRNTVQPVFYATTRAPAADGHYGNADGGGVTLGAARVRLGEPGASWEELMASHRSSSVDEPRPGAVESVEEFGHASRDGDLNEAERRFVAAIDAQIAKTPNRELIVYVHGYRVAFDEVAVQMGSFSHYLGQGATVTFQWPTGMMFWNYLTDCPRAEAYIPDIERLLVVASRTKAEFINVMAYSCGSPLLAAALAGLRQREPQLGHEDLQRKYRLGSVIFAASDVDLKTFAREYVTPALELSKQVVIYFSQADRALGFSTLIAGASRLGKPDIADLSVEELQRLDDPRLVAVDVTQVRGAHEMGGMKGHGYWYANEVISSDVALSLRYPIPPARRCLDNEPPGSRVWRIPEGYVDCVTTRLLDTFPELRSRAATPR
jgi:esterase/lipase superfamily enzyme